MGFHFIVIAPLLPSHCSFSLVFGCGVPFLVSYSVFLLMIVQQLVVILVLSQEGVSTRPSTLPSWTSLITVLIWLEYNENLFNEDGEAGYIILYNLLLTFQISEKFLGRKLRLASIIFLCEACFFWKDFLFIYLFIYLWLCWVFISVQGLSLVAASRGHSSSRCVGLSLSRLLLLQSTGSRGVGSVIVAHGPSRSAACGIFPDQGSNPCPLHWQADSQPLRHQGSPLIHLKLIFEYHVR